MAAEPAEKKASKGELSDQCPLSFIDPLNRCKRDQISKKKNRGANSTDLEINKKIRSKANVDHNPEGDDRQSKACSWKATGHKREGTGPNLLTRGSDADDAALAPSLVDALERLPHGGGVPDAFEAEVHPDSAVVPDEGADGLKTNATKQTRSVVLKIPIHLSGKEMKRMRKFRSSPSCSWTLKGSKECLRRWEAYMIRVSTRNSILLVNIDEGIGGYDFPLDVVRCSAVAATGCPRHSGSKKIFYEWESGVGTAGRVGDAFFVPGFPC